MAYRFGSATSLADVLAALKSACADGGWTITANVISKGDCFVSLTVAATYIEAAVGLGVSGGVLTSPAPAPVWLSAVTTTQALDFPISWFAHVFESEVYFFIRYGVDRFAYLSFGQNPVPGLPGKGVWISGYPAGGIFGAITYNNNPPYGSRIQTQSAICGTGPFWCDSPSSGTNSYVHHGFDGNTWSGVGTQPASANRIAGYFFASQPSLYNGEAVLLPVQVIVDRPSNKRSMVVELPNARYIRIDNLEPEEIKTLGSDRWKIYPFYRKNAAARNGGNPADHSGTFGWAIRYEGD